MIVTNTYTKPMLVLKNPENVVLVYTGEERYWKEYKSGSNNYEPQTFNTEHIFPSIKIQ